MNAKTERFEMRLDRETTDKIESWRTNQNHFLSKAEAIRRLIEEGLNATSKDEIKFSAGEKLILLMLCELYGSLNIKGDIDPSFIESAIHGGHEWGIALKYSGIYHDHTDKRAVIDEVLDILDMWDHIETSYEKITAEDQKKIENEAKPFGKEVSFFGFDGNNESEHLSVARFLVEKLDRFENLKDRIINSHMRTLEIYRRMLSTYKNMKSSIRGGYLNTSQLIELLNEMIHPENR